MKTEDKSFTFRLPNGLFEAAQTIAKSQDLNIAQLMRRVLKGYVLETQKTEVK